MVVTLFKKEFKDSYKIFFPILVLLIGFTTLSYINFIQSYRFGTEAYYVSAIVSNTVYRLMMITIISSVIAIIIGIVRYMYINIYNDKGYELFTLPVSSLQIIISKIMIVLIWVFILLTTFIVLTMFYQSFLDEVIMLENIKNRLHQLFSPNSALLHAAAYVNQLLYLIGAAAAILFAGAFANSKYVQKGRGVVAFIVVMIIALTVQTIESNVYNYAIHSFDKNTYGMIYPNFIGNFSYLPSPLYLNSLLIFRTACIVLLIFATKYMWDHKLQFQ